MKIINHITLNSGQIRQSSVQEINKELYFKLKSLLSDAQKPAGAIIEGNYTLSTSLFKGGAISTLYGRKGLDKLPILTTTCCLKDDGSVWKHLHDSALIPLPITNALKPIASPYIADRIEPFATEFLDAMKWTGDLSRCLGWLILDPRSIQ